MCGIAGIISFHPSAVTPGELQNMSAALRHRGPDGEGFWHSADGCVQLAHRRLAIIDRSMAAAQPMQYLHYTVVFNGEIYNYTELKAQLQQQGYRFSTQSDTEVLPAAYDHWGIDCLQHIDGMFAFALVDNNQQKVLLGRDRFGEKPLYHYTSNNRIFFASEMKALWAAGIPKETNHQMMVNYLALGFVKNPLHAELTFYKHIFSLKAGHCITIDWAKQTTRIQQWYFPKKNIDALRNDRLTDDAAIETFRDLLLTSIERRLRSDVAVGTSLSGGLDSSAIVAGIDTILHAKQQLPAWSNVCFSAVFPGFEKDEATYAQLVARHYNIEQHFILPNANDALQHWPALMQHQEEPLQSASVLTQWMVYAKAKEQCITVLLDGQGADEVLSGYKKYSHWYLQQLYRSNKEVFEKEKHLLLQNDMLDTWGWRNVLAAYAPAIAARQLKKKAWQQLNCSTQLNGEYVQAFASESSIVKPTVTKLEDILYHHSFEFGLEELLRYADRNSMAHSLEVRLPFLYHELVEFVFSLPSHHKIRNGFGKWILRKSMEKTLPHEIAWRKGKTGYEPPQGVWMQQAQWQERIHESRRILVNEGILQTSVLQMPVEAKAAHDSNNFDWRYLCAASLV